MRDPDIGIHLARKKATLGILEVVEPDVKTSFPKEGFSENLEGLPEVNFKTIWTYMVACLDAKKQLSTAKPLVRVYSWHESTSSRESSSSHVSGSSQVPIFFSVFFLIFFFRLH